jgi:hypothetical protein
MSLGNKPQGEGSDAVPLQSAVLCVDCECVTSGRSQRCCVCGSRSLLSLASIIGSRRQLPSLPTSDHPEDSSEPSTTTAPVNVEISIEWKQIDPRVLNDAVEGITGLLGPWIAQGLASCHFEVAPAASGALEGAGQVVDGSVNIGAGDAAMHQIASDAAKAA